MHQYKYLNLLTALSITMILVADVSAGKIINIFSTPVSVTVLFFPITFIFSDLLTEVYGYARARSVLWTMFTCSIIAGLLYVGVAYLPPGTGFDANEAYLRVLGFVPRVLLGGWLALWVGGFLNDFVLAKMKVWTKGAHLWSRTILSTIIGQFADTTIFYLVALYGILPNSLLVKSILFAWLLKVGIEIVCTPIVYLVVGWLKRVESVDHYDRDTNFNPFIFSSKSSK